MQTGKTAIVTGSTSGIGLGIAQVLAAHGTNIVLNGFGAPDEIDKIISDLKRQHNVGVMYSDANIADPDAIAAMVDHTLAEFGGIDILVNNPAFSTSRQSKNFRSTNGTRSLRSTCQARSTPAG